MANSRGHSPGAALARRWASLFIWCYLSWIVLTWTKATENMAFGAAASAAVAAALVPLGPVLEPWWLVDPRRLIVLVRIAGYVGWHMITANISLSRRIWSRSRPLRPGMVVVPTEVTTDGQLTAIGVLTSLIVDNQIVDLDRGRRQLQYHGVWIDTEIPEQNRDQINGPLEELIAALGKQ